MPFTRKSNCWKPVYFVSQITDCGSVTVHRVARKRKQKIFVRNVENKLMRDAILKRNKWHRVFFMLLSFLFSTISAI